MKRTVYLFVFLILALTGCSDNEDAFYQDIKQGWRLTESVTDGIGLDIEAIPLPYLMWFGEQSVCYTAVPEYVSGEWKYSDTRTAWSYDSDNRILNVASLLPVCLYVDEINHHTLRLHYFEYDDEGTLVRTDRTYVAADVEIVNLTVRLK